MLCERLDKDQREIYDYIVNDWIDIYSPYYTVGGYAGTGKTFLISAIAEGLREKDKNRTFAFCSYTGKATSVLHKYLKDENVLSDNFDIVSTIHGMIYRPIIRVDPETGKEKIDGWERKYHLVNGASVIFVDEGSMVNKEIWKDLLEFDVKIIVFGDCFQLPSIGEDKFNLMDNPNVNLTNIHRQTDESGIIQLSKFIREEGYIPFGQHSKQLIKCRWKDFGCSDFFNNLNLKDQSISVLCGFNSTRNTINLNFRKKIGYSKSMPFGQDKIIGLKNNPKSGIKNGQQGTVSMVVSASKLFYKLYAEMDGWDDSYQGEVYKSTFGSKTYDDIHEISKNFTNTKKSKNGKFRNIDFFDYSYAMTVHKSQASEWDSVVLIEQRNKHQNDEDYARWLYTAVTRAKKSLFIIKDYWPKLEK